MDRIKWTMFVVGLAIVTCVGAFNAAPAPDAMERARLEKMMNDGDTGMIVQVFRRHPGRTLSFIDQYLEGGLARIEKGGDPAKSLEDFRMAIRFAEQADKAFGVTLFTEYANAFASWSPSEQKDFREGQRAFKDGMKDPNSTAGRESLARSLALAESLGDLWGQAMARSALAEAELNAGGNAAALSMAMLAIELNAKLQLKEDCARSFVTAARAAMKMGQHVSAGSYQAQAWAMVEKSRDIDEEFRQQLLEETISVMEKTGMKDQANQIRQKYGKPTSDSDSPQTEPVLPN